MHFDKPTYSVRKARKKDIPKGLYTKDPVTGDIVFNKEVEDNQMVVPKSGHHFPIGARARIAKFFDEGSFVEMDGAVRSSDPLKFVDSQAYPDRIKRYEKESGLPEAVISGTGKVHGIEVAAAIMDFRFCGGATRVEPLLRRVVDTGTQTALDRRTRMANLKNAFALAPGATLNPTLHYILVDDVFTTGSTLNSCARALRRSGGVNVDVITFGHG